MKLTRVHRLIRLITLLQSGRRFDVDSLAGTLEVSRRTVFRDLNLLQTVGIPCQFDADSHTYAISRSYYLPSVNMTIEESLALLLVTRKVISRRDQPFFETAAKAAIKIESSLPPQVQEHCGQFLDKVDFRWPPLTDQARDTDMFVRLVRAFQQRCKVKLLYDSFYEGTQITTAVVPYRLVFIRQAWYLIGYSGMHEQVRTFKVTRAVHVELLKELATVDPDFHLDEYFGQAWSMIPEGTLYDVKLLFAPMVAGNVEEVIWHRTQATRYREDGSMIMQATVDGLREITWWILGYGNQVEVLGPPELRQKVGEITAQMAARYNGPPSEDDPG